MSFKKDFVWGAAAAAYQIEGAPCLAGGGESVWDMFCKKNGAVWNHHNGDVACDHYNRYREDVGLMSEIGLHAYRLSISWPRVLPDGTGRVNEAGLDFYDKLIDTLLEKNITPYVTLFHWDLPYLLHCRGGWLNPESVEWFAEYTELIVKRIGDRVRHWMTFNEPNIFLSRGYGMGVHAPGETLPPAELLRQAHHVLMAHGRSVQVLRGHGAGYKIGFAPAMDVAIPDTDTPENIAAARRRMFLVGCRAMGDLALWADPVFFGRYPENMLEVFDEKKVITTAEDMKLISQPLDFCAVNIYNGHRMRAADSKMGEVLKADRGTPLTGISWTITPEALYWGPRHLWERYGKPVIIAENGMSNHDIVSLDGKVHDPQRIDFLNRYLLQLERAVKDGVAIDGYFLWSIMDNFEWDHGYKERFGIIFVEYATQQRILKDSARWYSDIIKTNGTSLHRSS